VAAQIFQNPLAVNNDNASSGLVNPIEPFNLDTTDNLPFTYIVDGTPSHGVLAVNGVPATPGTTFTQADINAGQVTYKYNGGNFSQDSFAFHVHDSVGDTSSTFSIDIFALWQPAAIGDFNGDGIPDIIWQTFATTAAGGPLLSGSSEWLMSANGGVFSPQLTTPSAPAGAGWSLPPGVLDTAQDAAIFHGKPAGPTFPGAGDFNRDGFTDLLWVNSGGATSEWLGSASGTFTPVATRRL
jgi:hypothetical protein